MTIDKVDIAIIGAGAAGLMAAIHAGRSNPNRKIVLLDGAARIGKKILIAGGGRCNVTHYKVSENDYAGASRNAIKKVLRRFDVRPTVEFFQELGIELKQEETGKLFPTTNKAATVLDALISEVEKYCEIRNPCRVDTVCKIEEGFEISGDWGTLVAGKVILATGGKSIPKTGSDGHGFEIAKTLGHTLTPQIFPSLVPLKLSAEHFICSLKGITVPAAFELWSGTGKKFQRFQNSTLCTHFGLSGPSVLDISRYYIDAKGNDESTQLTINWIPEWDSEIFASILKKEKKLTPMQLLRTKLPDRLAKVLVGNLSEELQNLPVNQLPKQIRKDWIKIVTCFPLEITGNRGFDFAEATAGGVPLTEINLKTMESRINPGLFLCGEICDVDGRIGGFNFQWAWSSGYTAGISI